MENEEIFFDMFELSSDEVAFTDFQTKLFDKLDTIIENQSDISNKLDTVIEGQAAVSYALYSILGLSILVIGFKIVWTVVSKWLFGGI